MRFLISIVILIYTTSAFGNVGMEICHDHESSHHKVHSFYESQETSDLFSIYSEEHHDFHTKLQSDHFVSSRQNDDVSPKLFKLCWSDLHQRYKPENKLQVANNNLFMLFVSHQLQIKQSIRSTVILC